MSKESRNSRESKDRGRRKESKESRGSKSRKSKSRKKKEKKREVNDAAAERKTHYDNQYILFIKKHRTTIASFFCFLCCSCFSPVCAFLASLHSAGAPSGQTTLP